MKVICISGKSGSGKDTAAKYFKDCLESDGHTVLITHFADLLKYICTKFFRWDGRKNEVGREMLQTVGTEIVREKDPDYWARFICDMFEFFPDYWEYVIISDLRFENELLLVVKTCVKLGFGFVHMRVIREGGPSRLTNEQKRHVSETELDDYPADLYVYNAGDIDEFQDDLLVALKYVR